MIPEKRIIGECVGGNAAAFLVGGVIGAVAANAYHKKKSEGMDEKNPDEILATNKRNFAIDYTNIDEVNLKKRKMKIILNESQKIVGRKPVFYFKGKQHEEISSYFNQVLPYKLKIK